MAKLEYDEEFLSSAVRLYDALDGRMDEFHSEKKYQYYAVWELYGHDKNLFMASMDDVEPIDTFFSNFQPFRHSSQFSSLRIQTLEALKRSRSTKLRTAAGIMTIIQEDWDYFDCCWKAARKVDWAHSAGNNCPSEYPFLQGLKLIARDLYRRILEQETQRAIKFMSDLEKYNSLDSPSTLGATDKVNQKSSEICSLLAAAGSKKTHRMFDMLRAHFGFYLVSGAVRSEELPTDPGERLYCPRTSVVCADMELLIRTVNLGPKR